MTKRPAPMTPAETRRYVAELRKIGMEPSEVRITPAGVVLIYPSGEGGAKGSPLDEWRARRDG